MDPDPDQDLVYCTNYGLQHQQLLALSDSLTAHLAADSQTPKPSPQEEQRAVWGVCWSHSLSGAIEDPTRISATSSAGTQVQPELAV